MNLPPYVFDVDHVAKIRSGLSITVLEKKFDNIIASKVALAYFRKARTFGTVPTFDHNRGNADLLLRELHLHEVNFLIVKIFSFVVKR